ncbi:MAG: hypothetical protein WD053_05490 [Gracilimonas sp.]
MSLESSIDFFITTLKLNLLQSDKQPHEFDENKPVLEVLGKWSKGEYEFRNGLLLWSLQHAFEVDPSQHLNQSLQEIAETLSKKDRLNKKEYEVYRRSVYNELRKLEEVFEEAQPSREEKDEKEYRNSEN